MENTIRYDNDTRKGGPWPEVVPLNDFTPPPFQLECFLSPLSVFGTSAVTNYFVIDELNPDLWGFDGISMTERRKIESN